LGRHQWHSFGNTDANRSTNSNASQPNADIHANSSWWNSYSNTFCYAYCDGHGFPDAYCYTDSNTDNRCYRYPDGNAYCHTDRDTNGNAYRYTAGNTYCYTYRHSDGDGFRYTASNTFCDAYRNTDLNAVGHAFNHTDCDAHRNAVYHTISVTDRLTSGPSH
jgi:hypothetical protein